MVAYMEYLRIFWDWFLGVSGYYTLAARWIFPLLAAVIFSRCVLPLSQVKKRKTVWGYLDIEDGSRMPLYHWENSIGRSKLSDVVINLVFASRNHAVLMYRNGTWMIADMGSKSGVAVNGVKVEKSGVVKYGDEISLAGLKMVLVPPDAEAPGTWRENVNSADSSAGYNIKSGVTLILILIFQILAGIQLCVSMGSGIDPASPLTFALFILAECLLILIMRLRGRKRCELELLCCFLCGLNLAVVASASPGSLYKQLISIVAGMAVYVAFGLLIRDFGRARILKYVLAAGALVLLVLNLAFGETRFGAKNWINLGFITFQPLEFVKVAFVIAGTATLDRLLTTRNMTAFIGFSGACILALVLIRDFGTAVVFFGTFIVIAFMRSGDVRTIALISSGAVIGAVAAVSFMPYIASRFASWGHAWEYANSSGYQQTRTMIAVASGGLFGVGGGNGYLDNVAAADTDLVFGMLCEEWGLLVALMAIFIIVFFAIYAVLLTKNCRSAFYAIAACGAASIFLVQTGLNVFGSLDMLPLTGVTIPFISNGGSSMIASWGLLAFIKSADDSVRIEPNTAVKTDTAVKKGN
ncbi:MAG: FtsW/RodA/SpoVE family cell cycle protein [Bacillota bacterium]